MDSHSSLSSLSSPDNVRAKIRRPGRGKIGGESAMNLLDDVLGDSAAAAEEERLRREAERERAEEEERLQREREEEMAKLEAERALMAEQQAQEELRQHQAEMQAQVQRQKDIEAGLIDLEEEARLKREEEERKRAEAEAKAQKEAERRQANELKQNQEAELASLKQEEIARHAAPKSNPFIIPMILVALVLLACGAGFYLLKVKPENERIQAVTEGYSLSKQYSMQNLVFVADNQDMQALEFNKVTQEAPKVNKPKGPRKTTTAAQPQKPSLLGGGRLGKGKL
jgi:hypothetical protein